MDGSKQGGCTIHIALQLLSLPLNEACCCSSVQTAAGNVMELKVVLPELGQHTAIPLGHLIEHGIFQQVGHHRLMSTA